MIRAIIADDEAAGSVIIRYFIKMGKLPIEIVDEARDGEAALEMIRRERPDLIFLDIQMPCLNGFELMRAVPDANYIIITAYESFQYAQQALRLGAKDILLKPVEFEPFCDAITRALGWKFTKNHLTNEIIEYIQQNYTQKIEVNELARMYYTTASHIARTFKKHMGMGVISYLHEVRIQKAISLMQNTDTGIKEIAETVGYENINNFYKYFKQMTGCTPAAYREKRGEVKSGAV